MLLLPHYDDFDKNKIQTARSVGEDVGKLKYSCIAGGNVQRCNHYEIAWWFLKNISIKSLCEKNPAIPCLGIPERVKAISCIKNVHRSTFHNSQKVKITQLCTT